MPEREKENVFKEFFKLVFPYIKRLFLYLIRNFWYYVWFAVYFYISFKSAQIYFKEDTVLVISIIYAISLIVAFTLGDIIISFLEGARPVETKKELEYLNPIFREMQAKVRNVFPSAFDVRLKIIDSLTVNAIAIGGHTIAVTQGAIETFTPEELKGILAHEMSHLYYGDSKTLIINSIGNGLFSIQVLLIKLFLLALEYLCVMIPDNAMRKIFNFMHFLFDLWIFVLLWVGSVILSIHSRGCEFKADKFAFKAGYGDQLISALYIIQKLSLWQRMCFLIRMKASHPRISKRIWALERLTDRKLKKSKPA